MSLGGVIGLFLYTAVISFLINRILINRAVRQIVQNLDKFQDIWAVKAGSVIKGSNKALYKADINKDELKVIKDIMFELQRKLNVK